MPRPPSISPELMTTFVTVVKTDGDATRAAELLNINQPSMSKRLAFLQHAGRILRRPWLERVGKSWHLTEEGRRVLPAVEELVHRYRLLTEAIEEERPAVVFGTGSGGAASYVRKTRSRSASGTPTHLPRVGPPGDGPRRGGGQRVARPGVRPPGPDRDPGAGPPAAVRRGPVRRPARPRRRPRGGGVRRVRGAQREGLHAQGCSPGSPSSCRSRTPGCGGSSTAGAGMPAWPTGCGWPSRSAPPRPPWGTSATGWASASCRGRR